MNTIARFPTILPDDVDDDGAFSHDQIETLAIALAGLKDELSDTISERIAAAATIAKVTLEARLAGAENTARTDLHDILEEKFAKLRTALSADLDAAVNRQIGAMVKAFREETDLNLGAIRSELLGRIDDKNFGLALSDVDPRMLERSLRELKSKLEERLKTIGSSVGTMSKRLDQRVTDEVGELSRAVDLTQSRLNSGERLAQQRVKSAAIKNWKLDLENYTATPALADGSTGPTLDLRPMFQKFFDEMEDK